jgi:hypothetical protein
LDTGGGRLVSEKDKKESERASLEEVTGLLSDIVKKVTDRGAATLQEKLDRALRSFHGELKRIDEELEAPDEPGK